MNDPRQAGPRPSRHTPDRPHPVRRSATSPAHSRGLSLIEAMLVLTLISLACALSLPSLSSLFERQRLRGVANEIASELQWARSQALARNEALRYSIHATTTGSCTLVHTGQRDHCRCSGDGQAGCSADAQLFKASHWPRDARVTVEANIGSMLFDPLLGTTSPAGSIRIVDASGHGITHVVNILGRVRSCSPSATVSGLAPC